MSLTTATTTTCCFLAHETKNQEGFSQNGGGVSRTSPARISPAVPSVVVILAVALFLSGLLHFLVRFLLKRKHHSQDGARADANDAEASGTEATLQGQLQQLFQLHDAGLEQAVIDALPVFLYREVVGAREEPFDCAVCLCELAGDDELRLLPLCGHAFHVGCIDTWLLSSSTCPLCRGALFVPGLPANDPALFDLGELTVRLGKFKNVGTGDGPVLGYNAGMAGREEGETSTSNLDARRCYSMGSYQYVLAEANLQVSVHRRGVRAGTSNEVIEGKRICAGGKGDSFSVSKIWQWRKDDLKLPVLAPGAPAADVGGFQWPRRSGGDK